MKAVNLLPEEHRPRRSKGTRSGAAYAVVGVLAVLLGMATVYALTSNQVGSRQAEAADARQDAERTQAKIARLGAFGNFTKIKEVRVASVKDLAQARFDWERFVRELALVLPRETWLMEVDASTTGETEGAAPGAAATAPAGPSARLKGCAKRQPDVAKLMVRLRKMHRVKDVELKESAKQESEEGSGAAGAAAAAPAGGSGPAGSDCADRYEFEVIAQFDEARPVAAGAGAPKVPASLGGGQ